MTPIQRRVAAVSAPILLALSLTACGGAPTDASEKDFCEAYQGSSDVDADSSAEDQVNAIKDSVDELEEVGTPEGISDEEREGFEIYIEALGDIDEGTFEELEKAEDEEESQEILGVSKDDSSKAEAFGKYAEETCA